MWQDSQPVDVRRLLEEEEGEGCTLTSMFNPATTFVCLS